MGQVKINYIAKEILAKLIAQENLTIEHRKIKTAGFDVQNRVLILPIYKNVSENIYDLFIGHECSHALNTPSNLLDIIKEKLKVCPEYKTVINILEDARIEKIIKRKLPGLAKSFFYAYRELFQQDFFGINGKNVADLHLLDRINLHFKVGICGNIKISFDDKEKSIVDELAAAETFEQIIKIADKIVDEYGETTNVISESDLNSDENAEQKQSKEQNGNENQNLSEQNGDSRDSKQEPDKKCKNSKDQNQLNKMGETYNNEQKNYEKFKDESPSYNQINEYVNIPDITKIRLDKVIIDYKKVHQKISNYYSTKQDLIASAKSKYNEFRIKNSPIISYLVKEFELKKSADEYSRIKTSKTGFLDTNKIHSYMYSEDVFLKKDTIQEGKNHGLVMFLDCSDSMNVNMADTYEQLLILVSFCQKINIPFVVYGFADKNAGYSGSSIPAKCIAAKQNDMVIEDFVLKEYFSNEMSSIEFNNACVNIQMLINQYRNVSAYSSFYSYDLPESERLTSTPLNSTILCATKIVTDFKKTYNLQKITTIFLTDGESNSSYKYGENLVVKALYNSNNVVFRNPKNKKEYKSQDEMLKHTSCLYNCFRDITSSKVVGFYLEKHTTNITSLLTTVVDQQKIHKENKKDLSHVLEKCFGYDQLYVINTKELHIRDEEIAFDTKKTPTSQKIAKIFTKVLKNRLKNRIILSKFIEQIA